MFPAISIERSDAHELRDLLTVCLPKLRKAIETGAVWATDRLTELLLARRGALLGPFLRLFGLALRFAPLRRVVMRRMALLGDPSRDEAPWQEARYRREAM